MNETPTPEDAFDKAADELMRFVARELEAAGLDPHAAHPVGGVTVLYAALDALESMAPLIRHIGPLPKVVRILARQLAAHPDMASARLAA